jgi:hypothetical protein
MIRKTTSIFDGERTTRFVETRDNGVDRPTQGFRAKANQNAQVIEQQVFGMLMNLDDPDSLANLKFAIEPGPLPQTSTLCMTDVRRDYVTFRFTVDGSRGFHVTRSEAVTSRGRKDHEQRITLKQYPDGTWFPESREMARLTPSGEMPVSERVTVLEMAFNPTMPEPLFHFEFPAGTRLWNRAAEKWVDATGIPELDALQVDVESRRPEMQTSPAR